MRRFSIQAARSATVALALAASTGMAQVAPTGDSRFYYEIGGAEAVSIPVNREVTTLRLGGAAELGLGYSCGNFDPVAGVTNILNNVSRGVDRAVDQLVVAAGGAIASLPALILQRANPGLYELFQNTLGRAEAFVSLATKSCEQAQAEIAQGKNPIEDWIVLSRGIDWRLQMGNGGFGSAPGDVLTALERVEDSNGASGLPWIGSRPVGRDRNGDGFDDGTVLAGGAGQPPIKVTTDVTRAGYNIALGRAPDDTAAPAGDSRLVALWNSPAAAEAYAVEVLGDIEIQTHRNAARTSTPGHGLLPAIERDKREMMPVLRDLLAGRLAPTPQNLERVSAPGTLLTREVLDAARRLGPNEQAVVVAKLASEAATATHLERALMLRRLLLTGQQEPNVYASPAGEEIARLVGILDREIDQLVMEARTRRELFASTAGTLLDLGATTDARGATTPPVRSIDPRPIENGAVAQ